MDDEKIMKMALGLARKGIGHTSPNPMVGAVLVKDGRVVGKGYHQAAGKAHAEVNAIDDAGPLAKGATLFVTLEPCNHTGRTPPCTEKIIAAGIREVVVAMRDPNPNVAGGGIEYLQQRGISVRVGACEDQARKLNECFVKYVSTRRPFVILKCAATLDGRIAMRTGDSKWVTNADSKAFVHRLRHAVDAVIVGIHTIRQDNPRLTARIAGGGGRDPVRIILDTRLSIPEDANVLRHPSDSATILITAPLSDAEKRKKDRLEKGNVRIIESSLNGNRIDLDKLMAQLGSEGITSLLIEGGAAVFASALAAGIVDKVFFFYAPKISGGDDGVPICRGRGPERMDQCIKVGDITTHRFGCDVLIEGYIDK